MIKKIKSSLWLKIFLMLTCVLIFVGLIIYGIVIKVMPSNYRSISLSNYTEEIKTLVSELETTTLDEGINKIYDFCIEHSANAQLESTNTNTKYSFGEESSEDTTIQTISSDVIFIDSNERYILTLSVAESTVNQIMVVFLQITPVILVIILLISIVAAQIISRVITKPVIDISNISKKLAKLDMTWRCNTVRTDEIGVLANNLDKMAERLNETINELTVANKQLQKDIEEEKEREKIQTQFFRAVSHELKTPLTIIKGELEGMIYEVGEYKDRTKYLNHSLKVANEMENLIKEILSVAMIKDESFKLNENNFDIANTIKKDESFKLNENNFDIANTIKKVYKKYQGIAEDKEIEIITNIQDAYEFNGDERLLENAISNIISNAVMYSPKKAKVFIDFNDKVMKIENTGIHIENEDLKQLFNPFFRVDKSRNKNTGGSGLGLYIAKTIFDYHNISYKIENSQKGILFTIKLPQ